MLAAPASFGSRRFQASRTGRVLARHKATDRRINNSKLSLGVWPLDYALTIREPVANNFSQSCTMVSNTSQHGVTGNKRAKKQPRENPAGKADLSRSLLIPMN